MLAGRLDGPQTRHAAGCPTNRGADVTTGPTSWPLLAPEVFKVRWLSVPEVAVRARAIAWMASSAAIGFTSVCRLSSGPHFSLVQSASGRQRPRESRPALAPPG